MPCAMEGGRCLTKKVRSKETRDTKRETGRCVGRLRGPGPGMFLVASSKTAEGSLISHAYPPNRTVTKQHPSSSIRVRGPWLAQRPRGWTGKPATPAAGLRIAGYMTPHWHAGPFGTPFRRSRRSQDGSSMAVQSSLWKFSVWTRGGSNNAWPCADAPA